MFGILTLSSGLCFDIFGGKGIHVYFSECFHCARCIHFSGAEIGAQGEEVTCLRSQSRESIAGWGPNSSRLLLASSLPSLSSRLALLLLLLPPHHCPHQLRLSPISPHDHLLQWGPGRAWQRGVKRRGRGRGSYLPGIRSLRATAGPGGAGQKSGSGLNPQDAHELRVLRPLSPSPSVLPPPQRRLGRGGRNACREPCLNPSPRSAAWL